MQATLGARSYTHGYVPTQAGCRTEVSLELATVCYWLGTTRLITG
jgi:hypothetical protein